MHAASAQRTGANLGTGRRRTSFEGSATRHECSRLSQTKTGFDTALRAMKRTSVFAAILAFAIVASAQQATVPEPYSVKGDKLGETSAEWLASDSDHKNWMCEDASHVVDGEPFDCISDSMSPGKARTDVTYAGVGLFKQSASFVAKGDKLILYRIDLTFGNVAGANNEARLLDALNEKFGTASHEITTLQNGYGATSQEDSWFWTNGVSAVRLDYIVPEPLYHSPVATFILSVVAKEIQDRHDKARQKKARSDM